MEKMPQRCLPYLKTSFSDDSLMMHRKKKEVDGGKRTSYILIVFAFFCFHNLRSSR